jgi:acetyl-CoA carboxylase alpha subunit
MKRAFALIAVALAAAVYAAEPPAPESPISRVQELVSDLASTAGFSDEDAVRASLARLRTKVQRVLGDQRYRDNAEKLQQAIRSRDPISMAAELIESALRMRRI